MEPRKCPVLVDGKECGLQLTVVERELETGTGVYECPLGHRAYIPLDKMDYRKCPVLVNGKECALALTLVERELETGTRVYECPLGHRTYVPFESVVEDSC
jgi:hypothetical protein